MTENEKIPLQENTKDDSSDVERVRKDRERLGQEMPRNGSAPTEPEETKEDEEAEKGHS